MYIVGICLYQYKTYLYLNNTNQITCIRSCIYNRHSSLICLKQPLIQYLNKHAELFCNQASNTNVNGNCKWNKILKNISDKFIVLKETLKNKMPTLK